MYKVIKKFGCAKVGDIFNCNDRGDLELVDTNTANGYQNDRCMIISKDLATGLVDTHYLVEVNPASDKLTRLAETIDNLISTYDTDHTNLMAEYQRGNVQTCVKVEAETVYTNLIKVLNTLKGIINE